MERAGRAP